MATAVKALAVSNIANTFGATAGFAAVMGPNTTSSVSFPLSVGAGAANAAYTVCVVQRHVGLPGGPLLVGSGSQWYLGTYAGKVGQAYIGGGIWLNVGQSSGGPLYAPATNWAAVCVACTGTTALYYLNGTDQTYPGATCGYAVGKLGFNISPGLSTASFNYWLTMGPWAVAELITWNVSLSRTDLTTASAYLTSKYGVAGGASPAAPPLAPPAPGVLASLPMSETVVAWYEASAFNSTSSTWPDWSTQGLTANASNVLKLMTQPGDDGATASFPVVLGPSTAATVTFPFDPPSLPYSVCVVHRYVGLSGGVLLTSPYVNSVGSHQWGWWLGGYKGHTGQTFIGGNAWATTGNSITSLTSPQNAWMAQCTSAMVDMCNSAFVSTGHCGDGTYFPPPYGTPLVLLNGVDVSNYVTTAPGTSGTLPRKLGYNVFSAASTGTTLNQQDNNNDGDGAWAGALRGLRLVALRARWLQHLLAPAVPGCISCRVRDVVCCPAGACPKPAHQPRQPPR